MTRTPRIAAAVAALLGLTGCDPVGPTVASDELRAKVIDAGGDPAAKLSVMPVAENERSYYCGWLARGKKLDPVAIRWFKSLDVLVPANGGDRATRERVREICGRTLDEVG